MLRTINSLAASLINFFYPLIILFDKNIIKDFQIIEQSITQKNFQNHSLIHAVLLIEDQRFFQHKGVDVKGIIRAFYKNIFFNSFQGGSTIEQQYIRLITNDRRLSLRRKMRECILAVKLSEKFSKVTIINSYLSRYEFIGNVIGIDILAKKNGYNLKKISVKEASYLVTRLKYPFLSSSHPLFIKRILLIKRILIKHQTQVRMSKKNKSKNYNIQFIKFFGLPSKNA